MDIPQKYQDMSPEVKDQFYNWFGEATGVMSQEVMKMHVLLGYWSSLTVGQKTAIKTEIEDALTEGISQLQDIKTWVSEQ